MSLIVIIYDITDKQQTSFYLHKKVSKFNLGVNFNLHFKRNRFRLVKVKSRAKRGNCRQALAS